MNAAMAMPINTAATFLVHFFGSGLTDDRYVVERFKAHADGDIRPWPGEVPVKGKGHRVKRVAGLEEALVSSCRNRYNRSDNSNFLIKIGNSVPPGPPATTHATPSYS